MYFIDLTQASAQSGSFTCATCFKPRARLFPCGHYCHVKCLARKNQCNQCGSSTSASATISATSATSRSSATSRFNPYSVSKPQTKNTFIKPCPTIPGATQRMTIGKNGNAFVTVNQSDEWGRTTVIREIKKDKLTEFAQIVAGNKNQQHHPIESRKQQQFAELVKAKQVQAQQQAQLHQAAQLRQAQQLQIASAQQQFLAQQFQPTFSSAPVAGNLGIMFMSQLMFN